MNKLLLGVVLGLVATIWVVVYSWADDPVIQALMVFVGVISAVRAMSTSCAEGLVEGVHHD